MSIKKNRQKITEKDFEDFEDFDISEISEMTESEIILDMELPLKIRLNALNEYEKSGENVVEITNRLNSMYLFSGTKLIQQFLIEISLNSKLSDTLKILSAKCLCDQTPTEKMFQILDQTVSKLKNIPVPCEVDAILFLSCHDKFIKNVKKYFCKVINRQDIECDYRYKCILSLEHLEISEKDQKYLLKESQWAFIKETKNLTVYRILSAQYLLQKCKLSNYTRDLTQTYLTEFMCDNDLSMDVRADAADTLLNLGTKKFRDQARDIIILLGRNGGTIRTVFDNAQNVHHHEIDESANQIIEFLIGVKLMEGITFEGISKDMKDTFEESLTDDEKDLLNVSLNRISMDRALYGKFHSTLINILYHVWSYISQHEYCDEMKKRLLEELLDMSGKCSSGYAFRLANVISGFGDFNLKISWEDQIVGNLSGRLNKKIMDLTDEEYQGDILAEMTMLGDSDIKHRPHFLKFFRESLPNIRQEMYEDFKDDMEDTDFDMYFRKAIAKYEGYDKIF